VEDLSSEDELDNDDDGDEQQTSDNDDYAVPPDAFEAYGLMETSGMQTSLIATSPTEVSCCCCCCCCCCCTVVVVGVVLWCHLSAGVERGFEPPCTT